MLLNWGRTSWNIVKYNTENGEYRVICPLIAYGDSFQNLGSHVNCRKWQVLSNDALYLTSNSVLLNSAFLTYAFVCVRLVDGITQQQQHQNISLTTCAPKVGNETRRHRFSRDGSRWKIFRHAWFNVSQVPRVHGPVTPKYFGTSDYENLQNYEQETWLKSNFWKKRWF